MISKMNKEYTENIREKKKKKQVIKKMKKKTKLKSTQSQKRNGNEKFV